MNKARRQLIREVVQDISSLSSRLESIKDDEDSARDSMPENLQSSEKYEESERCSDIIGDAISELNDIGETLEEIT